ncbi:collagen-like triple helix repeat-containing protein [Lentilactobacillus kefiri]|uniref:collagen-like triple helix repeat-containing protein n=1 Tax=Lentilactobacillus kefiri TaxID=33962 RepID=UPI0021C2A346|nr:collagen-like protein [Lentilactobacillus kefiri]
MSKELAFTDDNDVVKYLDTTTSLNLALTADGVAFDLTNAKSVLVKIANDDGYIMQQTIDLATVTSPLGGTLSFPINQDIMNTLVPDDYDIEVWVTMKDGTQAIFPSDGTLGFSIEENLMSDTGEVIPVITFDQFEDQFDDMMAQMKNTVSNVKKGDKGDTGTGLEIKDKVSSVSNLPSTANEGDGYLVGEELYVRVNNAWKDCGSLQGPQGIQGIQGNTGTGISSTTIQYQISSSATTAPTGIWSNNIIATTTTNPYLWMKATLNYTDHTTKVFYLVSQKGDKGDTGPTGPIGPIGPRGPVGSGLVVKGTVKEASQLPTAGNQEGYCYFIGTDLYVWDTGKWKNCGSVSPDLSNYVTKSDLNNGLSTKVTDNKNGTIEVNGSSITPADNSKVVHSTDMRKPASDVAGIEEVNAKQDKIGYTPADDSKVVHNSAIDPSVMFKRVLTADDDILKLGAGIYCVWGQTPKNYPTSINNYARVVVKMFSGIGISVGNIIVEVLDAFNNKMINIYQGGPPVWSGWQVPNSGTMATKSDVSAATANKADDSQVAHLSGANNFDTVPTVKNNPLLLASSLPSDLARTTKDANFTGKLQKSGIDVATTTDVTNAVGTAVSPLNINTNWVSLSVDSSQIKDTDWDSTVTHCNYRIAHSTLYLTGKYKMLVTSNNKSRILFQLPTNIVSQISFPSTNEFQIGIIQAIARVPIMFMISLTNDGKISTATSPYDMNSSNFGAQYGLGLINAAIPLN